MYRKVKSPLLDQRYSYLPASAGQFSRSRVREDAASSLSCTDSRERRGNLLGSHDDCSEDRLAQE